MNDIENVVNYWLGNRKSTMDFELLETGMKELIAQAEARGVSRVLEAAKGMKRYVEEGFNGKDSRRDMGRNNALDELIDTFTSSK